MSSNVRYDVHYSRIPEYWQAICRYRGKPEAKRKRSRGNPGSALTDTRGTNALRALALRAHLLETTAAVHRFVTARDKRHLSLAAAISACHHGHWPWARSLLPSVSPARRTSCGVVHQALEGEELLLTRSEREVRTAVSANEGSVSVAHSRPPFSWVVGHCQVFVQRARLAVPSLATRSVPGTEKCALPARDRTCTTIIYCTTFCRELQEFFAIEHRSLEHCTTRHRRAIRLTGGAAL
jgi:hypothetical protein